MTLDRGLVIGRSPPAARREGPPGVTEVDGAAYRTIDAQNAHAAPESTVRHRTRRVRSFTSGPARLRQEVIGQDSVRGHRDQREVADSAARRARLEGSGSSRK